MENICKNCVNCVGGNHDLSAPTESFKTKDSNNIEATWYEVIGSKCIISDCWIFDVKECERFKEKIDNELINE